MIHGGQLTEAKRQFPHVLQDWIDLSTGINPYAYPFTASLSCRVTQLPNLEDEKSLIKLAAYRYGIRDHRLITGAPGTQILISLLPYIFNIKQVCVFAPTYMEHLKNWQQTDVSLHQATSLDQFMRFSNQEKTIGILCNPNNPDGRLFNLVQMKKIIHEWTNYKNHIVVDEAFMDFEEQSAACLLPCKGLTILRSFGKTYGLAGIRLGFLLSNLEIIKQVRQMLGAWSLSGQAIHIGLQAFRDEEWRLQTKNQLAKQVKQLDKLFIQNACRVVGGTHLFRLIEMEDAQKLWHYLAHHGIWVRKFDYNPRWLRFGMPQYQDWNRVQKTIKSYFESY